MREVFLGNITILRCIDGDNRGNVDDSCMSEYELYFNFVFLRTDQVKIRYLQRNDITSLEQLS